MTWLMCKTTEGDSVCKGAIIRSRNRKCVAVALLTTMQVAGAIADAQEIDFSRDIRPILSDYCFPCHGPDGESRQAELRLDKASDTESFRGGYHVIEPGDADGSELIRRLLSTDVDEMMPPADSSRRPSPTQIKILRQWIDGGAKYGSHWAWNPVTRPNIPSPDGWPKSLQQWPINPIDSFLASRLVAAGLQPSREAKRVTLIRRLSLDLIGLPPTPDEVDAFLSDQSSDAYERVVDRLLASPHFGERMAVDWLDAARYADTNGYQVDRDREAYAWRDWVIAAFNANMPFDQFTIEQIAGDLLPEPSIDQRVATGFHRNHMMNEEGGIIPEEFLAEYCADRVETTATVWLGQTFTCTRCHDHKFDPFTQRDYYGMFAFFHNVTESGVGLYGSSIRENNPPQLQLPSPELEARKAELAAALEPLQKQLEAIVEADAVHAELKEQVEAAQKKVKEANLAIPTTLVMAEMEKPRETFILIRGAYDKPGDRVHPATPALLPPLPDGTPRNRLGLARWLVSETNPLTARVTVNRFWQSFFGTGIVSSSEDFGSQGQYPTHPLLLDWLASEFVSSGWDMKAMVRLMVTSATYRQDSRRRGEQDALDPENRLLARGPRYRLPAESIRDQTLAASGLLVRTIGGPSVKPYHPAGLYEQVAAGGNSKYVQDKGDSLYRRSLYTYWKRSVPNPAMLAFDAPFREACVVRRSRTNTPMQALNLMNDPTYVESARFLANRAIMEGGDSIVSRISYGFRLVLARQPLPAELDILTVSLERSLTEYELVPAAASEMTGVGDSVVAGDANPAELAAYTVVMSTILNLDEAVTRE